MKGIKEAAAREAAHEVIACVAHAAHEVSVVQQHTQ